MTLKLYNTLTRKKQDFKPIHKNEVGFYSCGPTVYNYAHIGNLRTYIFNDTLKRVLMYDGFNVSHVMNITDVGHLTSDADSGEDKMLKGAKREHKSVWDIAEFYTNAFKDDIHKLNILDPTVWCKATDHIKEMVELIKKIEAKGYAYTAGGNVYFDTSKFKKYGKLAGLKLDDLKAGARIDVDVEKKNPRDFALWFTKSKFEDQEMKWNSPWGVGYPGWHIECSAMSMKYLGTHFDIHTGGIDHIPVHHTNEIAQSEAATGKKWVNYWLHGEFLVMDKGKMSKSGDSFITLSTIIEKGYDPLAYRYFCLGSHYRTPLTFSYEGLDGAKNAYHNLKNKVLEIRGLDLPGSDGKNYVSQFEEYINDDLNMPRALAVMWELVKDESVSSKDKYNALLLFDSVFGLKLDMIHAETVPAAVMKLVHERETARAAKDWKKSDHLRDEVKKHGYLVEDSKDGVKVKKI
ncbi:MAG: cysteine--tRNA ligase [Candidatus Woesearchaeota archaeon]